MSSQVSLPTETSPTTASQPTTTSTGAASTSAVAGATGTTVDPQAHAQQALATSQPTAASSASVPSASSVNGAVVSSSQHHHANTGFYSASTIPQAETTTFAAVSTEGAQGSPSTSGASPTAAASAPTTATYASSSANASSSATVSASAPTSSDIILSTLQRIATRSPLTVPHGGMLHRSSSPHSFLSAQGARSVGQSTTLASGSPSVQMATGGPAGVPATSSMGLATSDLLAVSDFASDEDHQGTWNPLPPQLPPHLRPPPTSVQSGPSASPTLVQQQQQPGKARIHQHQHQHQQHNAASYAQLSTAPAPSTVSPHSGSAVSSSHPTQSGQMVAGSSGMIPPGDASANFGTPQQVQQQQAFFHQRPQQQPQQHQHQQSQAVTQPRFHYHPMQSQQQHQHPHTHPHQHQHQHHYGPPGQHHYTATHFHHSHNGQFHQGSAFRPRPSPIPFDDGQILLPSFVSSLSSARSSSPRSFTASTLLYPLPEDEEAMLHVLDESAQHTGSSDAVVTTSETTAAMGSVPASSFSSVSTSASMTDFGTVDATTQQFVPSQHSAFRTPLSRPIAKKPASAPGTQVMGQHAARPHSPQHLAPTGAGALRLGQQPMQPQHQQQHQHQQPHHITSISPLQLQPHQHQHVQSQPIHSSSQQQQPGMPVTAAQPSPLLVDKEQQLRQVEGILQDALHAENATPCSKKDIEIFTHHVAMQRMAHENIKKRVQLHQQQQQPGQTSPLSASSPDIGLASGQPPAKKPKRSRTDQAQYQQLEEVFLRDPLPSRKTKERLAQELGLTARKVQVWFQNRRAKERRQLREMGINDSEVLPNPWGE